VRDDGPVQQGEYDDDDRRASIDDLLDRAVFALNSGDRAAATALAGEVLAIDGANADAEDLLTAPNDTGEMRRLTIVFIDVVESTQLSTRLEPEPYRVLIGKFRELVTHGVQRYEGHIASTKGDGLLAVFGHPVAHENDVHRAVRAGLDVVREVRRLSDQSQRRFGLGIDVRVGVHRGLVYLDLAQDDVYGLGANLAARVCSLAPPGSVVVSDVVASLIGDAFDLERREPASVKGITELVAHWRVIGERAEASRIKRGPLIGRDRELARLEKTWARARSGNLTTPGVVFRGEAGIGKSRLVGAATELAERNSGVVLELNGSPFHTDVGLHPFRALIESRCGIESSTDADDRLRMLAAEIRSVGLDPADMVPFLARVVGVPADGGYRPVIAEGRALQEMIVSAVGDYLAACAGDEAALLVAEDVHWFDPSSLEVLGTMLRSGTGRLMVVATGRDGGWLPADWPVKVFDLAPLTDAETDALTEALGPGLTVEQRATVRARCDGIPFYIEQITAELRAADERGEGGVPEALYEPLFARLRASAHAVPVVRAAAIIGRQGDRSELQAVLDLTEDAIDDAIDELEDAQVFEPWGVDGWRFRHELLREVAAEFAPPSVARALHARVADAMVGRGGDEADWPLVGAHYEHGERFADAVSAYRTAAAQARRRGALAEARVHLTKALGQLRGMPAGSERDRLECGLRLERGHLAGLVDGYQRPAAAGDFERCVQLLGAHPKDNELLGALTAIISYHSVRSDVNAMSEVVEMLRRSTDKQRPWLRYIVESTAAWVAFSRGDHESAHRHLAVWEEILTGDGEQFAHTIEFVGIDGFVDLDSLRTFDSVVIGDFVGADAALARAERRVERISPDRRVMNACQVELVKFWVLLEGGDVHGAARLAQHAHDLAASHGIDTIRLNGATARAAADALLVAADDTADHDELVARIARLTKLLDLWRRIGLEVTRPLYDGVVAHLLLTAGDSDSARAWLDTSLEVTARIGQLSYDAELMRLRAHAATDADQRQKELIAARDLARRQGFTLLELRAALDDFDLRGQSARDALVDVVRRMPAEGGARELARAQDLLAERA
jgi:class 3 adenylate cyclase